MMKIVFEQILATLKIFSIQKNQQTGLVGFDFFANQQRQYLMRICFAPLSSWILMLGLLILFLNPFRYHFSLSQTLGLEHPVILVLFDFNLMSSILFLLAVFVAAFWAKKEFLFLFTLGYFLSQGDININLVTLALIMVFLARSLSNFRYLRYLKGLPKLTWKFVAILTFLSHAVSIYIVLHLLRFFSLNGYFSSTMYVNRFEFYVLAVVIFYFTEIVFLAFWGHFSYAKLLVAEPTKFLVKYSTAEVLRFMSLGRYFKDQLLKEIAEIISRKGQRSSADLDLLPKRIVELHLQEESFLNKAKSELT